MRLLIETRPQFQPQSKHPFMGKAQFSMSKWKKHVHLASGAQDKKTINKRKREISINNHSTVVGN